MGLKTLWQRWLNRPATTRRPRPARRTRLAVERLEGRTVPASFTAATVPELIADINAANLSAEADTITLAPGKTFTLTAANGVYYGATGLPTIAADGVGLTIVGNGDVIERSTAKGTPAFRLLSVASGASLTLQDLTLQGGLILGASAADAQASGGGIFSLGTLALTGVTVQNNTAHGYDGVNYGEIGHAFGGGIYAGGVLTVQDSTIHNNQAIGGKGGYLTNGGSGFGGGLFVSGAATLLGATVTNNTAKGGAGGPGSYWDYDPFSGRSHVHASDGAGYGGGLARSGGALVYLDAYTVDHVKSNHATYFPNIEPPY